MNTTPPPASATAWTPGTPPPSVDRWSSFTAWVSRNFVRYANWLVSISWKRFFLLSLLLLILGAILDDMPPFSWRYETTTLVHPDGRETPVDRREAKRAAERAKSSTRISKEGDAIVIRKEGDDPKTVRISIGGQGVQVSRESGASSPTPPPSTAASSPSSAPAVVVAKPGDRTITITLPGAVGKDVEKAIEDAAAEIERDWDDEASADRVRASGKPYYETRKMRLGGDILPNLVFLWFIASTILKITWKRQQQAQAQVQVAQVAAAQAVETAEAESLKRQLAEARMATMQAQIEPHFLFNTLASIDHLIETDPPRASLMQKHLIALLRAAMPTMREATPGDAAQARPLGRELALVEPYLEILKMRMEDRLTTRIDVPAGLRSAEFPPMMLQPLVENAIQHGLEPKPEGGLLAIEAGVEHGQLAVAVRDTGRGFAPNAPSSGTGVGLANLRQRLALRYGTAASLTVDQPAGGGTRVTIRVPYVTVATPDAATAARA